MAFNLSQSLANIDPTVGKSELERIFEEEPVDLDTFIRDKKFLGQPDFVLSPIQRQFVMACERVYYPDLYPKMASEFNSSYWAQDIPVKNLFEIIWGKGSSDPETPVYDARTGLWVPLRDFKAGPVASAHISDGVIFPAEGTDAFLEGHGRMFKVKTAFGREIRVWEGHRFLTREKSTAFKKGSDPLWKRLWDMKVGDRLAVSTVVPEPSETVQFPDHEIELLGLLLGDGCVSSGHNGMMVVGEQSVKTLRRVQEVMETFPGTEATTRLDTSGGSRRWRVVPKNTGTRRRSDSVRQFCIDSGISGHKAGTKHVPAKYFRADNRQIAILVSRLIDTDGWVSISNTVEVGYSTISETLAEDVVRLMLRLGVAARKTVSYIQYNGEPYRRFTVRVRDTVSVRKLLSQLTLLDKEEAKERALEHIAGNRSGVPSHGDLVWDKIKSIEYDGDGEYWTLSVPGPTSYVSSSGLFNHNSGKDGSCRIVSLRIAYLLMCMKSPQKYFGLPEFDSIHLLNIAANAPQANRAFFKPMTDAVRRGWFADKAEPKQGVIQYAKNIEAVSGHSDAEGQEGLNIILGVADEIDAFRTRDEKGSRGSREASTSAESIIAMIESSANSRFPETYKRVAISYPRYRGSMIQRLAEQGKESIRKHGDASVHFVSGPYATWEVNPRISGKEQFKEDYERDPLGSAAKYECKPSFSSDPYFRTPEIFRNSVTSDQSPLSISYVTEDHYSDYSGETTTVWEPRFHFDPGFRPIAGARYAIHTDLAIKGDRAGIAMSHISKWEVKTFTSTDEEGNVYEEEKTVPHVKTDFVGAFEADLTAKPPREIQIRWVRSLIEDLKKRGFYIALASFDGYQSEDSLQILTRRGVDTAKISADRTDLVWKTLRDVASDGRLSLPYNQLLLDELTALTIIRGKVDHPPKGSKDLADALACSIVGAIRCGGSEDSDGSGSMLNTGSDFTDSGLPADLPFGMTGGFGIPLGLEGMGF